MLEDQRPGTIYWIDHYVVGSDDLPRWGAFMEKVIGATSHGEGGRNILFQDITRFCHHGAMKSPDPLPPSAGLGKGLPRHGLFIRQEEIDQHLRRLDELKVPHLDPVRRSDEGDSGIAIAWEDPDGNQFEFWAPDRLPPGAMDGETSVHVGRISHCVVESRDLERAAAHFAQYCALEPMASADIPRDTLVLPTVGGARIIYKQVDEFGRRTGGWGKLHATHDALVVEDQYFWTNYDYMWANVPEWTYDPEQGGFVGAGPDLPARTSRHGSPEGVKWYELKGRGDDWYDWDTNCFHFMGGVPQDKQFGTYEPRTMGYHFHEYVEKTGADAGASSSH